jgi:prevent-host-death family protein
MKYTKAIEPVTTLKTKSAELIRRAKETGQPIIITQNGKATAVLVDVEIFERQREALFLLRYLAAGEEEIRKGKGVPHQKALRRFEKKLKELRGD